MVSPLVASRTEHGLRRLNPARDLGQLADLIADAFRNELTGEGQSILRELRFLAWLGPLNLLFTANQPETEDLFTGFVWVQDGRVVGNVTVNRPSGHPHRWQISNVAVSEPYRRQGIGRKLVEAAIELIGERGGQVAYLYVREDNLPARHLYERLGFVEIDRATDLEFFDLSRLSARKPARLCPLTTSVEGEQLYTLVCEAESVGYRWLYEIPRSRFVWSADERIFRRLEGLLSGEIELQWGMFNGDRLAAGVMMRVHGGLNRRPHRLWLWVRPAWRGQVEEVLIPDVLAVLAKQPKRSVQVTLPQVESAAIEALVRHGFHKHRTLILMCLDL